MKLLNLYLANTSISIFLLRNQIMLLKKSAVRISFLNKYILLEMEMEGREE
jgi:hypothetical protein